jgi:hypothetical protein
MTRWFGLLVLLLEMSCEATMGAALRQTPSPAEEIVLQDDFNNPATSLFQPEEVFGARIAVEAGSLRMEVQHPPLGGFMSVDLPAAARDGTIGVDARLVIDKGDHYVAVGCRGSLNTFDTGYAFIVSPVDRYVGLYRRDQGHNVLMEGVYLGADGGSTSATLPTIQRVGLRCRGAELTGQVNGVDVVSATDDRFTDGYFYIETGMFANGAASERLGAVIDNLVVTVPPEEFARQRAGWSHASGALDELLATRAPSPLAGPLQGEIALQGQVGVYPSQDVGVEVGDFYAAARFSSPLDAATHPWDGVILFHVDPLGMGNVVLVSSAGFWEVMGPYGDYLAKGIIPSLDRAAGSPISVEIAAVGNNGYVRINGSVAVQFGLAPGQATGAVEVGAGMLPGNNRMGEVIYYDGLEVFALDPLQQFAAIPFKLSR